MSDIDVHEAKVLKLDDKTQGITVIATVGPDSHKIEVAGNVTSFDYEEAQTFSEMLSRAARYCGYVPSR